MLARIASVIALTIALAGLAISLVSEWLIMIPESGAGPTSLAVKVWGIAAAIAALPLILCLTTNKSPGAVDNASGLIAALLATRLLSADRDIGVIVTSGEELGLAGARAFLESSPQRAIALNCDTIDDGGRFVCMVRGRRGAAAAAVARVALRLHLPLRVSRVLPGILADSIAFADAGWDAITLSRGNLATLTRVHTSSDTRERLNGRGIAQAARLLCATAEELT
jgi:Zn-dependent M28 family amino/carboxypeptidase